MYQQERFFDFIKDKKGRVDYGMIFLFIGSVDEMKIDIRRYKFGSSLSYVPDMTLYILNENKHLMYSPRKSTFENILRINNHYLSYSEKRLLKFVNLDEMEMYSELVNTFNHNKESFLDNIKRLSDSMSQNSYEVFDIMRLNSMVGRNFDNLEIKK